MDLIALIISILAFGLSIFQFFSNSSREKKESTLIAFNDLQKDVFSKLVQYSLPMPTIEIGSKEWTEFTVYLAKIEHFSVEVNTGIYSKQVLNRLGGEFFIRQYEKLLPIILQKRSDNIVPGNHYDEFEKTVNDLKKLRKYKKLL